MATDSGQKFIRRNRAPRVHITYEDPYDAERLIELPFVMGVLADLSGNAPGSRRPRSTSASSSNSTWTILTIAWPRSSRASPCGWTTSSATTPDEKLSVNLRFNKMEDFSPAAVARQVPSMAKLLEAREQLAQPASLHGRQGRGRRSAQEAPERSATDGGAAGSRRSAKGHEPEADKADK